MSGGGLLGVSALLAPESIAPTGGLFVDIPKGGGSLAVTFRARSATAVALLYVAGSFSGPDEWLVQIASSAGTVGANHLGSQNFNGDGRAMGTLVAITGLTPGATVTVSGQIRVIDNVNVSIDPTSPGQSATLIVLDGGDALLASSSMSVAQTVVNGNPFTPLTGMAQSFVAQSKTAVVFVAIGAIAQGGFDNCYLDIVTDKGAVTINHMATLAAGAPFSVFAQAVIEGLTPGETVTVTPRYRSDNASTLFDPAQIYSSANMVVFDGAILLAQSSLVADHSYPATGTFVPVTNPAPGLTVTFKARSSSAMLFGNLGGQSLNDIVYIRLVASSGAVAPNNVSRNSIATMQSTLATGTLLTGLTPGTEYTVTVEERTDTSAWDITVSSPAHSGSLIVLDSGSSAAEQARWVLKESGRVQGSDAVDGDEFVTKEQSDVREVHETFLFTEPSATEKGNVLPSVTDGTITGQPGTPRTLQVDFPASWDGGNITVDGDRGGESVSETFNAPPGGGVVTGVQVFDHIAAITNTNAAGVGVDEASIQTSTGIGFVEDATEIFKASVDGNDDGSATLAVNGQSFQPVTAPDGTHCYEVWYRS